MTVLGCHSKVSSEWLPSYMNATPTVLKILKMAIYFPYSSRTNYFSSKLSSWNIVVPHLKELIFSCVFMFSIYIFHFKEIFKRSNRTHIITHKIHVESSCNKKGNQVQFCYKFSQIFFLSLPTSLVLIIFNVKPARRQIPRYWNNKEYS